MAKCLISILLSFFLSWVASMPAFAAVDAVPPSYVGAGYLTFKWGEAKLIDVGHISPTVTNLTFPFILYSQTARLRAYYLSQAYYFAGKHSDMCGYLGLQPIEDKLGKTRMQAIFSSFNPEAATADSNCRDGADGGRGVSCAVAFDADYDTRYDITVHKIGDHLWSGDLVNSKTGKTLHIGAYKLPKESGDLQMHGVGFLEHYGGRPPFTVAKCSDLFKISAALGPVYSQDNGGVVIPLAQIEEKLSGPESNHICHGAESGYVHKRQNFTIKFNNSNKKYSDEGWVFERGFVPTPIFISISASKFKIEPSESGKAHCMTLALYARDYNKMPIIAAGERFTVRASALDGKSLHKLVLKPDVKQPGRYVAELCGELKTSSYKFNLYVDGAYAGIDFTNKIASAVAGANSAVR